MRLLALSVLSAAAGLAQNAAAPPKTVPPPGVELPAQTRAELEAGLHHLRASIDKIAPNHPLLPDLLIFHEAVRYALQYNEFFKADEFAKAKNLLERGEERAAQLADGKAPWTTATGLVVRGYRSKIDQSVQPYGLVVPPSYSPAAAHRWRLDTWFHGRSETLSEVNFLADRMRNPGEFSPRDTIVLHLYGRFCNASKFAGEVDLFEALDAVKRQYAIDENRVIDRGFSMGGATAWHIGAHFAGLWAAVAPGAGFSETAQYQKLKLTGEGAPPWWEQKLWHLYDATDYAANLYNTTTIAYNGEIDPQKQAADMMEQAMAEEGMRLTRVVGPQTAHKYHPDSKIQIAAMLDAIAEAGRDPYPRKVRFTTWTLAYNRMKWVTVDALDKHWERARLNASIAGDSAVDVETSNVAAFTLEMGTGGCPLDVAHRPVVAINGQKLTAPGPFSDRSWVAHFRKAGNQWTVVESAEIPGLHKHHGVQGPVDDAFLDNFLFVSPTGTPQAPAIAAWVKAQEQKAIFEWRRQFRGDAQVRDDRDVTDADIASSNLILWGDPGSNRILARIMDRLPVKWPKEGVAPILIFPNPLNPKKYVVLNSGFTFADYAAKSNSLQTPKLPDWAMIDIATGKVRSAGFFNEDWSL
ncbi:MAG TPA: prolyl oligopeptidase family serine peptidase [Bryobacteraceae bacterium]|nr:prolyl oligopeptidase family serine peptidase [Bryobacteraceae bacterium]